MVKIKFIDNCIRTIGFDINKEYNARKIVDSDNDVIYELLNDKNELKYISDMVIKEI